MSIIIIILAVLSVAIFGVFIIFLITKHFQRQSMNKHQEGLVADLKPLVDIEKQLMRETNFFKIPYSKRVQLNSRNFIFNVIPTPEKGLRLEIVREDDGEKIVIPHYIPRDMEIIGFVDKSSGNVTRSLLPTLVKYKEKGFFNGDPMVSEQEWHNEWAQD